MTSHRPMVFALACLPACSMDAPAQTTPPPPPPAITGSIRVIHWNDADTSTTIARPPALDSFIEAEMPGAAGIEIRPAAIADDGSFSIAGPAPSVPVWLRIDDGQTSREDVYLFTDATEIDLGRDVVGTATPISENNGTALVVAADQLDAWQDADETDFFITNLGYFSGGVAAYYASNIPFAGDTAFDNLTFGWMGRPLPSTTQDDRATFVQVRPAHDDVLGLDYVAPIKMFQSPSFAMTDATITHIAGSFDDVPALDVPLHWTRSAFAAQADAMHAPDCAHELDSETYWVHALPGHGAHGVLEGTVSDPVIGDFGPRVVDSVFTDGLDDLDGTLHVANPYPQDWLYATYSFAYDVACPAPGVTAPAQLFAQVGVVTDDLTTPVAPLVSPPRAPRINNQDDLFAPQLGVGLHPTISWTPPAIGTPTSYELYLSEAFVSGAQGPHLMLHEDAELIIPGNVTAISLPRDVLAEGVLYELRIRAVSRPGPPVQTAPFRSGMPYGFADVVTSFFQP